MTTEDHSKAKSFKEMFMELLCKISMKLLSARFIMAVIMTGTGCVLALKGIASTEFGVLWGIVIREYFTRDRASDDKEQSKPNA